MTSAVPCGQRITSSVAKEPHECKGQERLSEDDAWQEPGRDMVIYGSASIVRTFANLGLIDQYQLLVYPVILGSGKPLFQDILHKVKLSLVGTRTHPSGVVVLYYRPVKE